MTWANPGPDVLLRSKNAWITTFQKKAGKARTSAVFSELNAWQVSESCSIGGLNRSPRGFGRCRDYQVVCTSGLALSPNVDEQVGMSGGDVLVVDHDRHRMPDVVEECLTGSSVLA